MVSGGRDVMLSIKIPVIGAESGDGVLSGADVGGQKSDVRGQKSDQKSEVGNKRT